jgi:YfiR/HmsC-like
MRSPLRSAEAQFGVTLRLRRIALAALCLWAIAAQDQSEISTLRGQTASEYDVKAAFLLNFANFVEWAEPSQPQKPFFICILGDDPFGGMLDELARGESMKGHPIQVRRVRRFEESCQILFMSAAVRNPYATLSRVSPGVLTVGESPDFLREGGMINFVVEDRRVRFDVNLKAAERASVRLSSQLLGVARSVIR